MVRSEVMFVCTGLPSSVLVDDDDDENDRSTLKLMVNGFGFVSQREGKEERRRGGEGRWRRIVGWRRMMP